MEVHNKLWKRFVDAILQQRSLHRTSLPITLTKTLQVTTEGVLACIDATAHKAPNSVVEREVMDLGKIQEVQVSTSVSNTSNVGGKVLVECMKEGGRLRIRPVTAGYHSHWNVQFPRDIRKEGSLDFRFLQANILGAIYVVDELLETVNGGFYRAKGDVKMLSTATDKFNLLEISRDDQMSNFVRSEGYKRSNGAD